MFCTYVNNLPFIRRPTVTLRFLSLHVFIGMCTRRARCQVLSDSTLPRWRISVSKTNGTQRINYHPMLVPCQSEGDLNTLTSTIPAWSIRPTQIRSYTGLRRPALSCCFTQRRAGHSRMHTHSLSAAMSLSFFVPPELRHQALWDTAS